MNKSVKLSMKYLLIGLVLGASVMASTPAMAKVYECQTKQAVVWQDGKIGPDKNTMYPLDNVQIEFDEASQKMWSGHLDTAKSPMRMKIVVPMDDQYDLVAVSIKESEYKGNYDGSHILRIRAWDKKLGPVFTLFEGDSFITGTCSVSE